MDQTYRERLEAFLSRHTYRDCRLEGFSFHYLCCGSGEVALTLFVGGLGKSQLWFPYIEELENDYRILAMDYPPEARTNEEVIYAVRLLMEHEGISSSVLVGSSIGGYLAQMFAREYPSCTDGLVLFSTAAFSASTQSELKRSYTRRRELLTVSVIRTVPYFLLKKVRIRQLEKSWKEITPQERAYMKDLLKEVYRGYTARQDLYMTRRFYDMLRQRPAGREDFAYLRGKILIRLSDQDTTFSRRMQKNLIDMMPGAVIENGVRGGHMATMMRPGEYAAALREFLEMTF